MAEDDNTTSQLKNLDTNQPTPLRGLVLRGVKPTPEVLCVNKGAGTNGADLFYKVAEAEFDPKVHKKAETDKLPTRKKKAKVPPPAAKAAPKAAAEEEEE